MIDSTAQASVPSVISAQQLTKRFGDFTAVNGVTFEMQPGEILGYLGPNGSGKTTTIRMLLGLLQPDSGDAYVLGRSITRNAEMIRPLVGYMSQKFALYDDLTAAENLRFYGGIYGLRPADLEARIREVMALVGLTTHLHARAADLSGGWRQRLALAIALIHRPQLLFLDEPTSGVDPAARRLFWDLIYTLANQGVSVFVSTHYMDEAEHCTRLGIMYRGALMALDTPTGLKRNAVPGPAWNIVAEPLIPALDALQNLPGILHAGLLGDHLHAITAPETYTPESLAAALQSNNLAVSMVEPADPTLEDVFIALTQPVSNLSKVRNL